MGSVALVDHKTGVLAELNVNSTASHSERLLPTIDRLFRETEKTLKECDGISVSVGPGSFTGLRIGLATAKGLAFASNKPIVGISTLEVLARGIPFAQFPVCPIIDARKKEIFTCIYEWRDHEMISMGPETVIAPESLIKKIGSTTIFAGNGLIPYGDMFRRALGGKALFASDAFNFPRASILTEIAFKKFALGRTTKPEALVPVYIRPSEAELNWKSKTNSSF
jgi:tRNA threonylcarbamoyladenosine biosynthesis protein TsaB